MLSEDIRMLPKEQITLPVLAAFYRGKAGNRYSFGHQIKDILREMEADIDKGTSLKGDLHTAWFNFRSILSLDKEETILDEIERGEEACLEEYNDFLKKDGIPHSIRRIIGYQRQQVARAIDRVDELEEKYAS